MYENEEQLSTQYQKIIDYYKYQHRIYDFTRWSFLFGRKKIVKLVRSNIKDYSNLSILEVGCGTGKNFKNIRKNYPLAKITGIELSKEMFQKSSVFCHKYSLNIELINADYLKYDFKSQKYDVIIFSYVLSMLGELRNNILEKTYDNLNNKGIIAVLDFNSTKNTFYKEFMNQNNITLDGKTLHFLNSKFDRVDTLNKTAYLGLWDYFMYLGLK